MVVGGHPISAYHLLCGEIAFVVLAIRPSWDEVRLRPMQPSDKLGKYKRKGDRMGAVKHDLEEMTSNKADEIAEQRYGREFSELPTSLQMQVWMDAEREVVDKIADQNDAIYDRMKEGAMFNGGNGHKPTEQREEHWADLELGRRLGK